MKRVIAARSTSRGRSGRTWIALAIALGAGFAYLLRPAAPPARHVSRPAPPAVEEAPPDDATAPADIPDAADGDDDRGTSEPLGAAGAPPPAGDEPADVLERNRVAVERAADGDLAGAIALLREAHALAPESDLVRKNLQTALINAGFDDIAAERFDAAVGRLTEGLALGDRGEIRRGLGYAYYRQGQLELARASLERAVEQQAADAESYVTLGRIHLERRDQTRALEAFEHALAAGADTPGLAETVARLRRDAEAERGYHTLASSHFVLKIDGREHTEAGRFILNALEDAYRRVGARFAYYPGEQLEVILYTDQTFRDVTSSPHWSGAVYDGRIKLPVGGLARGSERLSRTLRHEYAHAAIVTLSRGKAPVWLNEGLAQVAEEGDDRGRAARLKMAVDDGSLLPLAELEGGFTRFAREEASLAYAQAYFAARWLLEKKGSYNVRRLLEAMATADSTDAAFRQALALPYAQFESRLRAELERHAG